MTDSVPAFDPTPDHQTTGSQLRLVACIGGVTIESGFPPSEISEYIKDRKTTVWVDIQDPGESEAALLLEEFGFHPLAVEDACKGEQRPKIEEYKGYLFVVAYTLNDGVNVQKVEPLEVHAFVGQNYVVTVHRGPVPPLDEAYERWARGGAMLGEGVGFLAYTVFDTMVDAFFPVMDAIGDELDENQHQIFEHPEQDFVPQLLRLKKSIVKLRHVLAPMRDVFAFFLRHDLSLLAPESRNYFQNVYDHVIRMLDSLEFLRELATGSLEAYMTVLSNRLNQTMQTLTVYTIGLAFLGAVVGAWGMNVKVPFAESEWAFWLIGTGALTLIVSGMIWARFRRWL
jgi:magnesium transporter